MQRHGVDDAHSRALLRQVLHDDDGAFLDLVRRREALREPHLRKGDSVGAVERVVEVALAVVGLCERGQQLLARLGLLNGF